MIIILQFGNIYKNHAMEEVNKYLVKKPHKSNVSLCQNITLFGQLLPAINIKNIKCMQTPIAICFHKEQILKSYELNNLKNAD